MLVAADLQRPAAIRQLEVLAGQAGVQFFSGAPGETDPVKVARAGLEEGRRNADVVIVDTAGRLGIDEEMMAQVARVHDVVQPNEVLFVLDAMTGQDALHSAKAFSETLPLTGIVLTKIDGDARGGAALSATTITGVPVKFAGIGEKLERSGALLPRPDRLPHSRHGRRSQPHREGRRDDVQEGGRGPGPQGHGGQFTLEDFLTQIQSVKKMGGIGDLLKMLPGIPGMGKMSDLDVQDHDVAKIEAIIRSMTPHERNDPRIISGSRRVRIAKGSGSQVREVNDLIKQFDAARKMMKQMMKFGRRRQEG